MDITNIAQKYQQPEENLLMEIATLAADSRDLINLSLGDPDMTTNEKIIHAACKDAEAGWTHYTNSDGCKELLEAIAEFYLDQYQLVVQPSQIRATVGALQGMHLALQVLLNPDDEVIIHEPYFTPYKDQVILAGGIPVIVPTYEKDQFELDPARLEAAITKKTKALILNSPNNPTGAVFSSATLKKIADLAAKYNFYILADEIYEGFSYQQKFVPMATYAPEHTLTFSGFSKAFAMTGWRLGYMIAPDYINQAAKLVNENITYSAPTLSQRGGIYALKHAHELIPGMKQVFTERIRYIEKRVAKIPTFSLSPVQGGMYAFINISETGLDSVTLTKKLVEEAQVLVVPGAAFGASGNNYIRLAATQNVDILKEAFDRLEKVFS